MQTDRYSKPTDNFSYYYKKIDCRHNLIFFANIQFSVMKT